MHSLDFAKMEKTNWYIVEKILKPSVITDYNKDMNVIDVGDQMLSKFYILQWCKKAYK